MYFTVHFQVQAPSGAGIRVRCSIVDLQLACNRPKVLSKQAFYVIMTLHSLLNPRARQLKLKSPACVCIRTSKPHHGNAPDAYPGALASSTMPLLCLPEAQHCICLRKEHSSAA